MNPSWISAISNKPELWSREERDDDDDDDDDDET